MSRNRQIGGRVILVFEDDRFVAQDIALAIRREGARVAGPVTTTAEALRLIAEEPRIDVRVLDVGLADQGGLAVADALAARGVPFVFATGYASTDLPARFRGTPHWDKPFAADALARFLTAPTRPGADPPS